MSWYRVALPLLICLIMLLLVPALYASQGDSGANNTATGLQGTNGSPVSIIGGSGAFTMTNASDINYSVYDNYYSSTLYVSVITAQLYYNGVPYNRSGVPVTFTSDNDSVATLEPLDRTRPCDEHGQAKILLISNNTVGIVNITASSQIYHDYWIKDTCTVQVVGWGTLSGMVTDKNRNGVPDARMTLWVWDGENNLGVLDMPDNPQLTNDGSTAAIGTYTYSHVPFGTYNLTAEKDGYVYFAIVHVGEGTATANVAFPDYVFPGLAPPTLTPVPAVTPGPTQAATTASPSAAATATPTATPTPAPGLIMSAAILSIVAALIICRPKK